MLATYFTIVKRWKGWELSGRVPAKHIRASSSFTQKSRQGSTPVISASEKIMNLKTIWIMY